MTKGEAAAPEGRRGTGNNLSELLLRALRLAWSASPRTVFGSIALQVGVGIGTAVQLFVARAVLDDLLVEDAGSLLGDNWPVLALLVTITTLLGLAATLQVTLNLVTAEAVALRAVSLVLDVACAVEPDQYEDPAFHDKLERARANAVSRPVMAVNGLTGVLGAGFGAAGVALAAFALAPLLVPIVVVSALPAWAANRANSRRHYRYMREQTTDDRRRSYLMHLLSNRDLAKEVRVYGMEPELRRRHRQLHEERLGRVRVLASRQRRTSLLASVIGGVGLFAALAYLFWSIDSDRIGLASAGTALFALLFLAQRLRGVASATGTLYEASLFLEDVAEFTELAGQDVERVPSQRATERLPRLGRLRAEGVSFTYPESTTEVLHSVDMELRDGEVVAVVGTNGSGKTTLAKLLAGIHRPTLGRICWDGANLDELDPSTLRRSVAVLFQDFGRFALTAQDNVGLGDPERLGRLDEVADAARVVGADEVVSNLPGGWEQVVGKIFPEGTDLSGGQWQRLALARAMFRDAPFIIMDEPSSALDPFAEVQLLERMRLVAAGRTVLFISHRFSSVRLADRIYVMHEGRVVEEGDHESLMSAGGRYAEMYGLQSSLYGA